MTAGIGATISKSKNGILTFQKLDPRGTAKTSGMVHEGDGLLKIDKKQMDGVSPAEAHQLLQGEAGTMVSIKIRRFKGKGHSDFDCTLMRETGNEHILKNDHHGFQGVKNERKEETYAEIQQRINHGQAQINKNQAHKEPEKFTKAELEEYFARRKQEDEENIAAADKLYDDLMAKQAEEEAKLRGEEPEKKGWFSGLGGKKAEPVAAEPQKSRWWSGAGGKPAPAGKAEEKHWWGTSKKEEAPPPPEHHWWQLGHSQPPPEPEKHSTSWFGGGKQEPPKEESSWTDAIFGKPKKKTWYEKKKKEYEDQAIQYAINQKVNKTFEKDNKRRQAGDHPWPWQVQDHDDDWMDKDVPMPDWGGCCGARKPQTQPQRRAAR